MEKCVAEKIAQGMSEEEAATKCKAELEAEHPPASESTEEKTLNPMDMNLKDAVVNIMKEYGKVLVEDLKKDVVGEMKAEVQGIKAEMVAGLRKGVGLEKDPVVHLSEIEGLVRKVVLKETPHGKKSETTITDKPSAGMADFGGKKLPNAEDSFKELMAKRGAV